MAQLQFNGIGIRALSACVPATVSKNAEALRGPGMAVDVGGDAGLGPDDDLRTLSDGLAGQVAVDLHHRVHGAAAPVLQRALVALDG